MRTRLTFRLPSTDKGFPTDEAVVNALRTEYEFEDMRDGPWDERLGKYRAGAESVFKEMPEIRQEERPHVIFFGLDEEHGTNLVVTRRTHSQMRVRLLNENLGHLQHSTASVFECISELAIEGRKFEASKEPIPLYEKGPVENEIMTGTIIQHVFWDTLRDSPGVFVAAAVAILTTLSFVFFFMSDADSTAGGIWGRVSTGLITALLITMIGYLQSALRLWRKRPIVWTPSVD